MKNILHRATAFSLAICMAVTLLFAGGMHAASAEATDFDVMLGRLETLEQLANSYRSENRVSTSVDLLMMRYIRSKRYSSTSWTLLAGSPDDNFKTYVESHDPDVAKLQDIGSLALPNGDVTDFVHMCATINTIISGNGDIGGWIGDTCQLVLDIQSESGDTEQLTEKAGLHFRNGGHFGKEDWVGDMDAYNLHSIKSSSEIWAACFARYYDYGTPTEKQRVAAFIQKNWGASFTKETSSKAEYRTLVKERYSGRGLGSLMMSALKSSVFGSNIPAQKYHDAACYAVADYMYETMCAPAPNETNVRIDFANETLEIAAGIAVNSAEDFKGTGYVSGAAIVPGTTFYAQGVRDVEAGSFVPSEVVTFIAPQRSAAPEAPKLTEATVNSLSFASVDGAEYSIDGGETWRSESSFAGLTPHTDYSVICRYRATETAFASESSEACEVSTPLPEGVYIDDTGIYLANNESVRCMMVAAYQGGRMVSIHAAGKDDNGIWSSPVPDDAGIDSVRVFALDEHFLPLIEVYQVVPKPT